MSFYGRSEAYDLTLFEETVPDVELSVKSQKNNVVDLEKERNKRKKARINPLTALLGTVTSSLVLLAVVAIIHGQAQLTELNQQITDAETQLTELQSYYTQLEMKVETKLNPAMVEEYAKDVLGMSKTESYQKEFISLSQGDKAVVVGGEEESLIDRILNAISGIWSEN
ncbi:MAG: septum formation initiator family protein [Lachnospiraceae bacterium]|nr:septum formation initiator family protein [Lachnospiraceae bacterium]